MSMLSETIDRWHKEVNQKGLMEGIQQGMQQGIHHGEVTILLRQFGSVSDDVRQRIMDADANTLVIWSERILTAETVEEVLH